MSGPEQVMSVLLDAEDMRLIDQSWPGDMRVGVCLMPSGECELMLFHREESERFPDRLRDHFGLRPSEISIHPQVPGFATHQMKYSEERALANLLSDNASLVEDAQDYSVNFAYAREEGLDPMTFMVGNSDAPKDAPKDHLTTDESKETKPLTFSSSRKELSAEKPLRNLHLDLEIEARKLDDGGLPRPEGFKQEPQLKVPDGFKSAAQLSTVDSTPSDFEISRTTLGGIVIRAKTGVGPKLVVNDARNVLLRDDRKLLALQMPEEVLPQEINLLPHAVPSALLESLTVNAAPSDVAVQDGFVYVTLGKSAKKAKVKPAGDPLKVKKRWALVRLVGLTAATIAGLYFILSSPLGTPSTVPEVETKIDWQSFH